MTQSSALFIAACIFFIAFLALGLAVAQNDTGLLDTHAAHLRARALRLALLLTWSGRSKALLIVYAIAFLVYEFAHLPVWIPIVLLGSQVLSQAVVESFKLLYRRIRPAYWLVGLEAGHSYPSGHATTAVVTFVGWAFVVAAGSIPVGAKHALVAVFVLWAIGIAWSRLALGAHYLSDVAGGILFGSAWTCALLGLLLHVHLMK